jgi:hypothetical protein
MTLQIVVEMSLTIYIFGDETEYLEFVNIVEPDLPFYNSEILEDIKNCRKEIEARAIEEVDFEVAYLEAKLTRSSYTVVTHREGYLGEIRAAKQFVMKINGEIDLDSLQAIYLTSKSKEWRNLCRSYLSNEIPTIVLLVVDRQHINLGLKEANTGNTYTTAYVEDTA